MESRYQSWTTANQSKKSSCPDIFLAHPSVQTRVLSFRINKIYELDISTTNAHWCKRIKQLFKSNSNPADEVACTMRERTWRVPAPAVGSAQERNASCLSWPSFSRSGKIDVLIYNTVAAFFNPVTKRPVHYSHSGSRATA